MTTDHQADQDATAQAIEAVQLRAAANLYRLNLSKHYQAVTRQQQGRRAVSR